MARLKSKLPNLMDLLASAAAFFGGFMPRQDKGPSADMRGMTIVPPNDGVTRPDA